MEQGRCGGMFGCTISICIIINNSSVIVHDTTLSFECSYSANSVFVRSLQAFDRLRSRDQWAMRSVKAAKQAHKSFPRPPLVHPKRSAKLSPNLPRIFHHPRLAHCRRHTPTKRSNQRHRTLPAPQSDLNPTNPFSTKQSLASP